MYLLLPQQANNRFNDLIEFFGIKCSSLILNEFVAGSKKITRAYVTNVFSISFQKV